MNTPDIETPEALWARIEPDFRHLRVGYPYEAAELLRANRDALTPFLLQTLEAFANDPQEIAAEADYILHFNVICFLVEFRETRAYPLLVSASRLDEDAAESVFGDFVSEVLPQAFAVLCGGDLAPLENLAADTNVCPWIRNAVARAIVIRICEADLDRNTGAALLEQLALREAEHQRAMPEEKRSNIVLTSLMASLVDLRMEALLPQIRLWFAEGMIDPFYYGKFEKIEHIMRSSFEAWRDTQLQHDRGYLRDAVKTLEHWQMYQKPEPAPELPPWPYPTRIVPSNTPLVRETPKVGRNDPCSCGSGKKFKKCCGA